MPHQSRLILISDFHDRIIDLNDIVSARRIYYPGYNGVEITLRSDPSHPITFGEPYMDRCWEILCAHTINPPCP